MSLVNELHMEEELRSITFLQRNANLGPVESLLSDQKVTHLGPLSGMHLMLDGVKQLGWHKERPKASITKK